jgi:hypothetical protein
MVCIFSQKMHYQNAFFFKTCQNMEFNEKDIASHHFQSSLSGAQRWIRPTAHQIKNCLSNGLTELNLA